MTPYFLPISNATTSPANAVVFRYELATVQPSITSGAWRTVILNTSRGDTSVATVTSNIVTIAAGQGGKFLIIGWTRAGRGNRLECQIVCSVVGTVRGTNTWSSSSGGDITSCGIHTVETLADGETIEFQHQVQANSWGEGGGAAPFGGTMCHAELMFVKLS